MTCLDKRYGAKVKKEGGTVIAMKRRTSGHPSTSQPLPGAPS